MHFLPVAERELRVASRQPRTYRTRVVGALAALTIAGYLFWLVSRMAGTGSAARQLFATLVQLAFMYCLFAGVRGTADCLSREKREGTLGLLFLTPLRSYDIIMGKLLATSLHAVYALIATVPIFAICLIGGGVQSGEFWRIVLALFNTLFFSLAIGLSVSAAFREERRATQTAAGIVVIFGFVLPGLGEYLRLKTSAVEAGLFLKTLSPTQTLDFSGIPTAGVKYFWWSLLAVNLLAWLALILACWNLPRRWQDVAPPQNSRVPWRERWQRACLRPARAKSGRARRLDRNPFYWLATRSSLLALETWILLSSIVGAALLAAWLARDKIPLFVICLMAVITVHAVLKLQICAAACDQLAADQQNGTLEVLLVTPLTVREILHGHWLALIRFSSPFVVTLVVLELVLLIAFFDVPSNSVPHPYVLLQLFCAGIVTLLVDMAALGWVGTWQALVSKKLMDARSQTLLRVLILPWVLFVLWFSFQALTPLRRSGLAWQEALFLWFAIGTANSIAFSLWARARLFAHFRLMATQRFQLGKAKGSWWRSEQSEFSAPALGSMQVPRA